MHHANDDTKSDTIQSQQRLSIILVSICLSALLLAITLWIPGYASTQNTSPFATEAHIANIDQCRNGPIDSPEPCVDPSSNPNHGWVNGNSNSTQAHWAEGESIPYRLRLEGLAQGVHTVEIQYDFTEPSAEAKHAIDYLTSYTRTETTADACTNVLIASECSNVSTLDIPIDPVLDTCETPQHIPAVDGGVPQEPGSFVLYNGTLISSSYVGTHTCQGSAIPVTMMITFSVSTANSNAVLAWGGHIAAQFDWGNGESAGAISGSPYHMRLVSIDGETDGSQDLALQSAAIYGTTLTTKLLTDGTNQVNHPITDTATIEGTFGGDVVTSPTISGTINFYVCADNTIPFEPPFINGCAHTQGEFVDSVEVSGNGTYTAAAYTPQLNGYYCFRTEFISAEGSIFPFARETNALTSDDAATGETAECILLTDPTSITLSSFSVRQSNGTTTIAFALLGAVLGFALLLIIAKSTRLLMR
jgi:hypothetical protein